MKQQSHRLAAACGARGGRLAAACGAAAALALSASPAVARTHIVRRVAPGRSWHAAPPKPLTASATAFPNSPVLGGFAVAPSEGLSSLTATYKIPTATCASAGDEESTYIGPQLSQDPSSYPDLTADVLIRCDHTATPAYYIEAYNGSGDNLVPANAGDKVQARIFMTSGGQTVAVTRDLTTANNAIASKATASTDTTFELGATSGFTTSLIPVFKTVTFSNAMVNGADFNLTSPAPTGYQLNQDGPVQVVPTKLPAAPSTTVIVTEKHHN